MFRRTLPYTAGLLVCLLFAALGVILIPYPGAQYDEALFASAIHDPEHIECVVQLSFGMIPVMLMTYIGTLKAAIYMPIVHWFGGTNATLRLPVLAMGTASIWLFYLAMRRLAGTKAALLAALLLATDVVYLLTCVFDWGPVALQHILFTGLLYAGVRYVQETRLRWLFAAALCAGLALWDKALFMWLMAGFGVALLAVFPRDVWHLIRTPRRLAVLLLGFVLGAAPFFFYNALRPLNTFRANVQVDEQSVTSKFLMMDRTLDGSGLMGYIVREDPEGPVQNLKRWEKIPLFLNDKLGNPRNSLQHILLVAVLLLAPIVCWFGPNRRAAMFFLLGGVLSYAMMLITRSAGGSAHHTILLWPVPQILLALLLGQVAVIGTRRVWHAAAALVVVCTVSNLTVFNTHLAHFVACGPTWVWSDAVRPLVYEIGRKPGRMVFAVDWGITQQIEWYGNGRIGFHRNSDGVVINLPEPMSVVPLEKALADPRTLFVMHPEGKEAFVGVRRKMIDFAVERGYRDTITQTIQDRHGATTFELHEFSK
jgi:Dolichyl-phosphate-mannose-protein mannosyltransferase